MPSQAAIYSCWVPDQLATSMPLYRMPSHEAVHPCWVRLIRSQHPCAGPVPHALPGGAGARQPGCGRHPAGASQRQRGRLARDRRGGVFVSCSSTSLRAPGISRGSSCSLLDVHERVTQGFGVQRGAQVAAAILRAHRDANGGAWRETVAVGDLSHERVFHVSQGLRDC